jgi:hypothetical protein
VTFLADRDGPFDAFVTQVGSGDFVNLTNGRTPELLNELVTNVGFSGDGTQVWTRVGAFVSPGQPVPEQLWLIPTMGGPPRLFLESAVMAAWSPDGTRVAYHDATPGDPIHIADRNGSNARQVFVDAPGSHCHFLTWSPDARFCTSCAAFRSGRATSGAFRRPAGIRSASAITTRAWRTRCS